MNLELKIKTQRRKARVKAKYKPKHWLTKVYGRMKQSSKTRTNCTLDFSKEELREWIEKQDNFMTMFNKWIESGFIKDLVPSIDRLDDYKGYSFDNIRLTTWEENNISGRFSKKNKEQCSEMAKKKWSKVVLMLDLDGKILNEYYSAREAARVNDFDNSTITKVCRGEKITHKGYKWRYKNAQ